jgi:hypothetical protein
MNGLRLRPAPALLAGALALLVAEAGPAAANRRMPEAPAPRKEVYDPDRDTCTEQAITVAYGNHLRPWADQPEPVLARLRLLQQSMTRTSLSRCIERGLMTAEQARRIERSLGLAPATADAKLVEPQSGTLP